MWRRGLVFLFVFLLAEQEFGSVSAVRLHHSFMAPDSSLFDGDRMGTIGAAVHSKLTSILGDERMGHLQSILTKLTDAPAHGDELQVAQNVFIQLRTASVQYDHMKKLGTMNLIQQQEFKEKTYERTAMDWIMMIVIILLLAAMLWMSIDTIRGCIATRKKARAPGVNFNCKIIPFALGFMIFCIIMLIKSDVGFTQLTTFWYRVLVGLLIGMIAGIFLPDCIRPPVEAAQKKERRDAYLADNRDTITGTHAEPAARQTQDIDVVVGVGASDNRVLEEDAFLQEDASDTEDADPNHWLDVAAVQSVAQAQPQQRATTNAAPSAITPNVPADAEAKGPGFFARNPRAKFCARFFIILSVLLTGGLLFIYFMMCLRSIDGMFAPCTVGICGCTDGLDCEQSWNKCFHNPRRWGEPCGSTSCADGYRCINNFCSAGECGDSCKSDSDCHSGSCRRIGTGDKICADPVDSNTETAVATCLSTRSKQVPPSVESIITRAKYRVTDEFSHCKSGVYDQGCCGSCVAFAVSSMLSINQCVEDSVNGYEATGTEWNKAVANSFMEMLVHSDSARGYANTRLSEQHLLSCSFKKYASAYAHDKSWTDTCDGFDPNRELSVVSEFGIPPYRNQQYEEGGVFWMSMNTCTKSGDEVTSTCHTDNTVKKQQGCKTVALYNTISGTPTIYQNDWERIKRHVARYGAFTGTVFSGELGMNEALYHYDGHVLRSNRRDGDPTTNPPSSSHQVMFYGWGTDQFLSTSNATSAPDYFILHNSWSISWGSNGEAKVAAGQVFWPYGCVPLSDL